MVEGIFFIGRGPLASQSAGEEAHNVGMRRQPGVSSMTRSRDQGYAGSRDQLDL